MVGCSDHVTLQNAPIRFLVQERDDLAAFVASRLVVVHSGCQNLCDADLAFILGHERTMMVLVSVMILAFTLNLFWTGFSPTELVSGLVPRRLDADESIIGRAMLATSLFFGLANLSTLTRDVGWAVVPKPPGAL